MDFLTGIWNYIASICVDCWSWFASLQIGHWLFGVIGSVAAYYARLWIIRGINKARRAFHAILNTTDDIQFIKEAMSDVKIANSKSLDELRQTNVSDKAELNDRIDEVNEKVSELRGEVNTWAGLMIKPKTIPG